MLKSPQILSKAVNFLQIKCAVILSLKISFYFNNAGEITKKNFFFGDATHKK